ncbi:MAG TPA: porin [bacterium]|nr:porin [bacterium]
MKKWTFIIAVVLMTLPALPLAAAEVETPSGAIQLSTAAKFVYGYSPRNQDTRTPAREDFTTALLDVGVAGSLGKNLSYRIELASSWNQDMKTGSLNGKSNPNELGTAGVRQVSIVFHDLVPWTRIEAGTFMPPISNYMPRPVWDLDLIQYPLMNNASRMNTGIFGNRPAARDLSQWQQAGFNLTFQPPYMIRLDLGVWNGTMPGGNANFNPDLGMARSIVATFEPADTLSLSLAWWGERFLQAYPGIAKGARRDLNMWFLYGAYKTDILEITADYAQGMIPQFQLDKSGDFQDLNWEGWQVTAGYWILPRLEILARYEYINPNAKDSVQIPASLYDQSTWITLGANWRLSDQAEVSVNYVIKNEEGIDVNKGKFGEDPLLPGYNPKYSVQNNDLLLIQAQVWQ